MPHSFQRAGLLLLALLAYSAPARGSFIAVTVGGVADPWLAGMPAGSKASGHPSGGPAPDVAFANSPTLVVGLPLGPGMLLTFDASGQVGYGPEVSRASGPDGMLYLGTQYTHHLVGPENGIADVHTRINSLLGVFLDDNAPNTTATPTNLDFRPTGNVLGGFEYTSLSPQLKQPFFIGDGRDGLGHYQSVIVPAGATRLFLGVADGWDWTNNTGSFEVHVNFIPGTPDLHKVPEPGTLAFLVSAASVGICAMCRRRLRRAG